MGKEVEQTRARSSPSDVSSAFNGGVALGRTRAGGVWRHTQQLLHILPMTTISIDLTLNNNYILYKENVL